MNRITFVGNTTTRDNVIRREIAAGRGRRVQHRGAEVQRQAVEPARLLQAARGAARTSPSRRRRTPTTRSTSRLKLEEQNRNQLTFGAGVSQFEGFFGQLSFQTANFLGRGESLTLSLQAGSRAQNYSARVHRAVPVRPEHHRRRSICSGREVRYIGQFTQRSTGSVRDVRVSARPTSRGCSRTTATSGSRVTEINTAVLTPAVLAANPFLQRLAADRPGRRAGRSARSCPASCTTRWTTRSSRPAASG